MTSQRPDLLTPEERELADRLGRIAPHGTPSATLDARILGAAHAAAGGKASHARPRSRWPALVGIAATVALALGVVWQLRPVREVPTAREEEPSSAVMRPQAATAVSKKATPTKDSDPQNIAESQPRTADVATHPRPAEPHARVMSRPSPLPPPPVVFDDPSPVDAPESVSVPPPAPPAPVMDKPAAPMAAPMQRKAAADAAMESAANDAMADTGARARAEQHVVTIADVPVDSDRMLAPADWIERIRQRRDSGDLDGARTSLDALRRAHPTLALPEDVLAIATAPATHPER